MRRVALIGRGDLGEWRDAARGLVAAGVRPDDVEWCERHAEQGFAFEDAFDDGLAGGRRAYGFDAGSLEAGSLEAGGFEAGDVRGSRDAAGVGTLDSGAVEVGAVGVQQAGDGGRPPAALRVPAAFIALAEAVVCHSDPARFMLLYRLLWRLQSDRRLLEIASDADVSRANHLAKSVRRDTHKMTAFVRFKEVGRQTGKAIGNEIRSTAGREAEPAFAPEVRQEVIQQGLEEVAPEIDPEIDPEIVPEIVAEIVSGNGSQIDPIRPVPGRPAGPGRRRFVAWFEPDHHIVARVAPFFQRRFTDMDWLIATPRGSAAWDGARLAIDGTPCNKPDLADDADELWRTYYASIFNPARLKVKAMQAEMPKKYWRNLPEAELIPGLIANAEASLQAMARKAASEPLPYHHRIQEAAARAPQPEPPRAGTLAALRQEAAGCTRCPLHQRATQTVCGEGPDQADVMVVGEQPGDREDLAGRPFVGPAGQVFDAALAAAGIDRASLYLTNAVKHFKYEPRGKRRIHQKPNMGEVQHCRWWLSREVELVQPRLIVAMGATALFALTDMRRTLEEVRGAPITMADGRMLFVTVHPSYLLRIPDEGRKTEELARFHRDLGAVGRLAAAM